MFYEVLDFLKMNDVNYKENVKLADISPIKIGAVAKTVLYPDSEKKLILVLRFLRKAKIPYKILGRMSNVLPPDNEYTRVVIRTDLISDYSVSDGLLFAGCGATLPSLAFKMADLGYSGLEELSGIPGSIGGALVGNAGAFGREISELVSAVRVFDLSSFETLNLKAEDFDFSYRSSGLNTDRYVVLSVGLKTIQSDRENVKAATVNYKEIRRKTQPVGELSLGSTFKRPGDGLFAAKMIDECGLKGKSVGGAMVSKKHAGFIINSGGASARDYIELSEQVIDIVFKKFRIRLEREVEILG